MEEEVLKLGYPSEARRAYGKEEINCRGASRSGKIRAPDSLVRGRKPQPEGDLHVTRPTEQGMMLPQVIP